MKYLIIRDCCGQIDYYDPFKKKFTEDKYFFLSEVLVKHLFINVMARFFPDVPTVHFENGQFEPAHEHPVENDLWPMGFRFYVSEA